MCLGNSYTRIDITKHYVTANICMNVQYIFILYLFMARGVLNTIYKTFLSELLKIYLNQTQDSKKEVAHESLLTSG